MYVSRGPLEVAPQFPLRVLGQASWGDASHQGCLLGCLLLGAKLSFVAETGAQRERQSVQVGWREGGQRGRGQAREPSKPGSALTPRLALCFISRLGNDGQRTSSKGGHVDAQNSAGQGVASELVFAVMGRAGAEQTYPPCRGLTPPKSFHIPHSSSWNPHHVPAPHFTDGEMEAQSSLQTCPRAPGS